METGNNKHRLLIENLPDPFAYHQMVTDSEGEPVDYIFLEVNQAFEKMTGLSREQVIGKKSTEVHPRIENPSIGWIYTLGKMALTGESMHCEHYSDISGRWYVVTAYSHEPGYFAVFFRDITEVKQAKAEQRRIEWMLDTVKIESLKETLAQSEPPYGSLTQFNTFRFILDSIGEDMLAEIAKDYLGLLETSTAIYEKNGDYALGIFSSGWCRFLDNASRWLCQTDDNRAALQSGKWLCHESCWIDASKNVIETGEPVDIACHGGLRLYGVPIWAKGEVVGAINFGYGDPPQDPAELQKIADKYSVNPDELRKYAEAYESRPPFIIHLAKERLHSSAKLIGTMLEHKQAEQALRKSEEKHRRLFETMTQGIIYQAADGAIISANPAAERILGLSFDQMQGKTSMDPRWQMIEEDGTAVPGTEHPAMIALRTGQTVGPVTRGVFHPDKNAHVWLNITAIPLFQPGETEPFQVYATIEDITKRKQAEEALKESEEKYRTLYDQNLLAIFLHDFEGNIFDVNNQACLLLGYSYEELLEMSVFDFIYTKESGGYLSKEEILHMWHQMDVGERTTVEDVHQRKDESIFYVEVSTGVIRYNNENMIMALAKDITERKRAEEKIRYLSFHDSLTGLYNRAYLDEEMHRLDTKRQLPISIIMVDLNGLKLVNDAYGHESGDEMLKNAAEIIKSSCRREDIVARWGGDEFVLLLPQTPVEEVEKIHRRIKDNCRGVDVKGVPVSLAVGSGTKDNTEKNLEAVLKEAEDSMYKQKLAEQKSVRGSVLNTLLTTLQAKSYETEEHTIRMINMAWKIGEKIGLGDTELNRLNLVINLHDIGKINVPETILTKEGFLTDEEWEIIKTHPKIGYRITRASEEFSHVSEDILAHHERWDGQGYPQGLKEKEIPLLARITAIVDAYDVMSNGRPYKEPMSQEEIITEFKRCAGSQFDPDLVDVFLTILKEEY